MTRWKTPTPTSMETLMECSPELPEELQLFYRILLCGLREPTRDDIRESVERKVMAMSSYAVYNASRGTVRPWKNTVLGLGFSSLTGSKLIIRILNRLGSTISYDEVKALKTEFAFSGEANERDAPDGIELQPTLGTGLAWDNYDVNMDTIDGKGTLHATVGICYQNMNVATTTNEPAIKRPATCIGKKRRQYDGKEREIDPYYKQLKKARFDLSVQNEHQEIETVVPLYTLDLYWLLQAKVGRPLPLFPGFYSQFVHDELPLQRVGYMDPISAPTTRNDVVRETMKRSVNVAKETGQEYGIVTYDLAVALKAYSIQALDAPLFDKILIMLGNFHLELAFYGAIGTFINESGPEHLLTESGILAEGSLMGFIHGKFYNRCVRIHDILALLMEMKLYERFLSTLTREKRDDINELLGEIPDDSSAQESFFDASPVFLDHRQQYEMHFKNVINGELGPTAQYWSIYIFMINRVHRNLMHAQRTNDLDSYITILPVIIEIFFALNRLNYACWGVLYLNQLENAAPQMKVIFQAGAFSIRRTNKNYSRTAIDLTLEQTVNRDAASPMRGIVGFHYFHNAIIRWCISSTQRGMSVTKLRNMTGLETEDQPTTQLRISRTKKDSCHRDALYAAVSEPCDPFSAPASTSAYLLNIATGKAVSDATRAYLTESLPAGHALHLKFGEECAASKDRFLKPIKRRKMANFTQENSKKSPKPKGIRDAAESLRDIFIQILVAISKKTTFSLRNVMMFPIIDYPLSIAHSDGSLLKTEKSKLLHKLEALQDGFTDTPLPAINATLIDGGLLIHSYLSAIGWVTSYGNLARSLLSHVCGCLGNEIHVLFDTYKPMSLKLNERNLRGANDLPFVIAGPEQAPKQNCKKLLVNGIFKDQLAKFLLKKWQEDHYGAILVKKTLILSYGGKCVSVSYNNDEKKVTVEHPVILQGIHEESDTLIAFHAAHMTGNVVVRASDTDVMVILVGMLGRRLIDVEQPTSLRIIMDCGSGNSRRYIDISDIVAALEVKQKGQASAMPGLHAFTGCDFTASFYRKGKIKPFEILEQDTKGTFINFFRKLTQREKPDQTAVKGFLCFLYGLKGMMDINEARHAKLCQMTGKVDEDYPMKNLKKVDCALLPPCSKTVQIKVQRAHFVSIVWGNAYSAHPESGLDSCDYGWKIKDGCYVPVWFMGPAEPNVLFEDEELASHEAENDHYNNAGNKNNNNAENDNDDNVEEYEDADNSGSEIEWSDDSESEDGS